MFVYTLSIQIQDSPENMKAITKKNNRENESVLTTNIILGSTFFSKELT